MMDFLSPRLFTNASWGNAKAALVCVCSIFHLQPKNKESLLDSLRTIRLLKLRDPYATFERLVDFRKPCNGDAYSSRKTVSLPKLCQFILEPALLLGKPGDRILVPEVPITSSTCLGISTRTRANTDASTSFNSLFTGLKTRRNSFASVHTFLSALQVIHQANYDPGKQKGSVDVLAMKAK